jgi:DNA-directed RNA polymerase beta subunit
MAIREFATHYGRICPIETPEGKCRFSKFNNNANLNQNGFIETPFWKIYSIVLNTTDPLLFDSKQKSDFTIALGISKNTIKFSYLKMLLSIIN